MKINHKNTYGRSAYVPKIVNLFLCDDSSTAVLSEVIVEENLETGRLPAVRSRLLHADCSGLLSGGLEVSIPRETVWVTLSLTYHLTGNTVILCILRFLSYLLTTHMQCCSLQIMF